MRETIRLLGRNPNEIRKISDRLARELPLRKETTTDPQSMNENRILELENKQKIRADVDPEIMFDISLW